VEENAILLKMENVRSVLGERPWDSHKGMFGYIGILGGSLCYSGAAKLANLGASALRSGCGVATLGVPASLAPAVAPYLLESTLFPMPDRDGKMIFDPNALDSFFAGKRAVAVGMGWGRSSEYEMILDYLFRNFSGTILLDADGLNTLAESGVKMLTRKQGRVVLTPHPMEFSRLSGNPVSEILKKPIEHAKSFASEHEVVVLLKGSVTTVTDGKTVYQTDRGCAGMATAGSGDVLSGVLAGMLGYLPPTALTVAAGAYLAGLAGELAEKESNPFSMVASDTARAIPRAFSKILK